MESKHWRKRDAINKAHRFISRHIKTVFVSLCSLGAWVQSDRGVLQEALPDRAAATRAGAGTPGRAGSETLGPVHPEDSDGQTLPGRSLCHQGSRDTCLRQSAVSQGKILLRLFGAAASGNNAVLMNAGNVPNGSESVIWPLLSTTKCCQTTAQQQACQVQDQQKNESCFVKRDHNILLARCFGSTNTLKKGVDWARRL